MDAKDLARIEHHRRWLRPDWRRFVRPDWERHVNPAGHEAMRKDFALRDRAFETPLARRWREEQEAREREEQERQEAEHQAEIEREALEIKAELAELRFELVMAEFRRKANFNANQPRVPAGNPDGGQWTDGGGGGGDEAQSAGGRNDPRVLSDATPDNVFKPGAQLAQADTQRRYSVNLNDEEIRGGHTLRDHIGKTDDELLAKVRGDRGSAGIFGYARKREGSFESRESANDFVNRTLEQNQVMVDHVADGKLSRAFLNMRFGYRTGREAFRPSIDSEPYLRDTYEVGVEIRHEPRIAHGYRVHTAYPRNEDPR